MNYQNDNIEWRKNKYLNMKKLSWLKILLKDGFFAYKTTMELNSIINIILNEYVVVLRKSNREKN